MHKKRGKHRSVQQIHQRRSIATVITVGCTDTAQATRTRQKHARGYILVTRWRPHKDTKCGNCKTTRHTYVKKG